MTKQPGPPPLDCATFRGTLGDHFHERLDAERRRAREAHAAVCGACAQGMRLRDALSCQEVVGFLDAYVAGELSPEHREAFEWHLALCPDCCAYLDAYRKTIELGQRALQGAAGELADDLEVPLELVHAILSARAG